MRIPEACPAPQAMVFPPEPWLADWRAYVNEGTWEALANHLPQFSFPVEAGMSTRPEYVAVTSGLQPAPPPVFTPAGNLRMYFHETGLGPVPVLEVDAREDFVALVQRLAHRNEPAPIAPAVAAMMISGYVNVERVQRLEPGCRDRFIILLSGRPYSGVPASALGLHEDAWLPMSLQIRLCHEACHYVTRRCFPKLKFGVQDELVADFIALWDTRGRFVAQEFFHFMGLENYPPYRQGGRLEAYGDPGQLADTLLKAARNLERLSLDKWPRPRLNTIAALTWLPLETLAGEGGVTEAQRLIQSLPARL